MSSKHLSFWEDHCDLETFQKWCGSFDRPFKNNIRKDIKQAGYKNILDCGAGVFSEYYGFKDDGYLIDYTGVEITPSFVEFGKKKGIKCLLSPIDDMPFEDNQFEATICLDVLNHQLDYKKTIIEMLRVTKNIIFISFFKPFVEEEEFQDSLTHWDSKKIKKTPYGTLLERVTDEHEEAVCLHHYFSSLKMSKFLTSLNVKHSVAFMPAVHYMLPTKTAQNRVLKIEK